MRDFIQNKLETIWSDFTLEAAASQGLCKLKDFSFAGGSSPDYADQLVRKYYLLRYFPAYLAEYYLMYGHALDLDFIPADDILALSLGCGCGVDYWGLHFAAQERIKSHRATTFYTGYDINPWEYRDTLGNWNVHFNNQSVGDFRQLDHGRFNVIAFPKSINDMPAHAFEGFLEALRNTEYERDRIMILCSFMTNENSQWYDFARLNQVIEVFTGLKGFACMDDRETFLHLENRYVGLNNYVPEFDYSLRIRDTVGSTLSHCPNYRANYESCEPACHEMNKSPILTTTYVNYAVRRLTRE